MTADQEKQAEDSQQRGIGPGERLQAARIRKGLSIEDVANRMHLSTSILQSIEENNFDEITAPIFVKGYLRAYARIVALSEDEMIAQYLEMYSEEDPPISSTSNMTPELSSTDTRIKWMTYFVIIVLGVLLAAWWWNKQQNQEPPLSLDVQSPAGEEMTSSEPVVESDIQAGSDSLASGAAAEAETTPAMESEVVPDEESSAMAAAEPDSSGMGVSSEEAAAAVQEPEPVAAVEPQQGEVQAPVSGTTAPSADGETSQVTEPQAMEPEPAQAEAAVAGTRQQPGRSAPSGDDKLRIVVHADTWADVKDASNYQLVYDLLRADSTLELSGEAPFAVFLGNGHGVEIQFNGEEVSFGPRIRNDNTARLQVGG